MKPASSRPKFILGGIVLSMLTWLILLLPGDVNAQQQSTAQADEVTNRIDGETSYIEDQAVIKFGLGSSPFDVLGDEGYTIVEQLDNSNVYLIQFEPGRNTLDLAAGLNDSSGVEYAHPNYVINSLHPVQGSYPFSDQQGTGDYASQDAAGALHLTEAHQEASGQGVTVGVIDGGIDKFHPAIIGSAEYGHDFVDGDDVAIDQPGGLTSGHGTFVAGLVHLTAPLATLRAYRVINENGQGDGFTLARAIERAVDDGCDVINISLVLSNEHLAVRDAIDYAVAQGVTVVVAAGNDGRQVPCYPGAESGALSVSALDSTNQLATFSNYGDYIDVCAPGQSVYSSFRGDYFAWWSGTSFAAPFVSGQAALLYQLSPGITPAEVRNIIRSTATSVDALNPDFAGKLGSGLVNPALAAQQVEVLDSIWLEPDTVYFTYYSGDGYGFPPYELFRVHTTLQRDFWYAELIEKNPDFVLYYDTLGYTFDSNYIMIDPAGSAEGEYEATIRYHADGIPNTADLTVRLTVLPPREEPASASLSPNLLEFTAPLGSEIILSAKSFLTSTNAPAIYTGSVNPGGNGFTTLFSTGGLTSDSVLVTVDPSVLSAPGHYYDQVDFQVEGIDDPAVMILHLQITDTVVVPTDSIQVIPDTLNFVHHQGDVNVTAPFMPYQVHTNLERMLWHSVLVHVDPGFTLYFDSIGYTLDTNYVMIDPYTTPIGNYSATIRYWVDSIGQTADLTVNLAVLPAQDTIHLAWLTPNQLSFTAEIGSAVIQEGAALLTSTNAPAAYTGTGTSTFTTLLTPSGTTNDSIRISVDPSTLLTVGNHVDTLLFMVDGVAQPAALYVNFLITPDTLGGGGNDSLWVNPIEATYFAQVGVDAIQSGIVTVHSTSPDTIPYFVDILDNPNVVNLPLSPGYTNVPFYFSVNSYAGMAPGMYADTLLFHLAGSDEAHLYTVVNLVIDTLAPIENIATVYPFNQAFEAPADEPFTQTGHVFIVSNPGPGNYTVEVKDTPDFTTVIDQSGTTDDSAAVQISTGTGLPEGLYVDTLLITVSGAANSPLTSILYLTVGDTIGTGFGSADLIPFSQAFVVPAGQPFADTGSVFLSCTQESSYRAEVLGNNDFVVLLDTSGTTDDSIPFVVRSDTGMATGLYFDTILCVVPNAANSPVYSIVYLSVGDTVAGQGFGEAVPYAQSFTVRENSPTILTGSVFLTSTAGISNYTVSVRGVADFIVLNETSGVTEDSVLFEVNTGSGLAAGIYADTLDFEIDNTSNSPVSAIVYLEVLNDPADTAWVNPDFLQYVASEGSTTPVTLSVYLGALPDTTVYNATVSGGSGSFVSLTTPTGTPNSTVSIVFDPAGYAVGEYYDTVSFSVDSYTIEPLLTVKLQIITGDSASVQPLSNYPNPFNPQTTITFGLPVAGKVSLTVYNIIGQKVSTLVDDYLPAGGHDYVWDGRDEYGREVSSGIYLYRLVTENEAVTRKMVLMK